ncbi:hypothetical protein L6452_27896 [Arctium lappa]|uniref:Uncharacterized protein n=1 Tax=Arctium lappa TaxID=4217 RepID=A0ACB8ZWZ0_ARCLA|nr:hypothetical protein L6452_27896 [Arctium lappa]
MISRQFELKLTNHKSLNNCRLKFFKLAGCVQTMFQSITSCVQTMTCNLYESELANSIDQNVQQEPMF